jgi:hypothetical protein
VPPGGALTPGGFAARKLATHLGEILRGVSEANIETLRREHAALNRGDLPVVLDLLDSDIEWHEPALGGGRFTNRSLT